MKAWKKTLLIVTAVLTVTFIFSNSMLDVASSSEQSGRVLKLIKPILELFVDDVTEHLVRKLAHFTEFFMLGLELTLVFCTIKRQDHFIYPLLICMVAALIDETIQLYTGRGSQVQDVWLDIGGAATGIIIVCLLLRGIQALQKRKLRKRDAGPLIKRRII